MADAHLKANKLRENVSRFLTRKSKLRVPLIDTLSRLTNRKMQAVIFGGAARDLMLRGPGAEPRDVDIVVDCTSVQDLRTLFSDVLVRTTRFGGLSLNVRGWTVDIWPLLETWALKEQQIGSRDFETLTRTTFLNVEAVIVDLTPVGNRGRRVFSSGFFEALQARTLDINLAENPFPELCAIRTLVTAAKLKFQLSEKLAKYVLQQVGATPLEQFIQIQMNHYGATVLDVDTIYRWSKIIQCQIGTQSLIRLPFQEAVQFQLWQEPRSLAA